MNFLVQFRFMLDFRPGRINIRPGSGSCDQSKTGRNMFIILFRTKSYSPLQNSLPVLSVLPSNIHPLKTQSEARCRVGRPFLEQEL